MRGTKLTIWLTKVALFLAGGLLWLGVDCANAQTAQIDNPTNESCLVCHGNPSFSAPDATGKVRSLYVAKDRFGQSVHGKRQCVECHTDITEIPHKPGVTHNVSCVNCHDTLWKKAQTENKTQENAMLGNVVQMIDRYQKSVHARANRDNPNHANAICYDCHEPHYVYPKGSAERMAWRLDLPNICGRCHVKERALYATSVHGKAVLNDKRTDAAICADCHTTHDIADPANDNARLVITRNCGNCHQENLKTYMDTYHGKVNTLGYAYTAKCFDCHGSHAIQKISDPTSTMYGPNRYKTCQKCHVDATPSFATFEPHGTAHNFSRYPIIWIASKFMLLILGGMLAFFWAHTALWFYREFKERAQRIVRPHVALSELRDLNIRGKYYERFSTSWRIVHLISAISLMMLALTGMSVLYAETTWAQAIMHWLGGPRVEAVVHRTFAVLFVIMFVGQLGYLLSHVIRNRRTFDWFGPNSLVPRMQDMWDLWAMFRWFFGSGPRPVFDRWTYWQKFDYWAPVSIISFIILCGVMLWAPTITAKVVPGWVFNVVTIFHGEGALLAVLFLFTVHFFNNHFRPDKFPLEVVMFTGAMPLEKFKSEHRVEYNRLVASGELEKHLVDAPSQPMTLASTVLGFVMIVFGLILLVLVLAGVYGNLTAG
jgi:cytochrome b subunit of formate dehydrogenase